MQDGVDNCREIRLDFIVLGPFYTSSIKAYKHIRLNNNSSSNNNNYRERE